jgi:hypothetical protein
MRLKINKNFIKELRGKKINSKNKDQIQKIKLKY